MNTEDKFYFGKHGQPERFAESLQAMWDGKQYRVLTPSGAAWYSNDGKSWTLKNGETVPTSEVQQYNIKLGTGYSRPGQPERFAIGNKDTMATLSEFEKLLKPHWDVLRYGETKLSGTHDPRDPDNEYRYQAKRAISDFVDACMAGPRFAKQIVDDIRLRIYQYIDQGRDKSVPQYRAAVQIAKALDAIRGPLKSGFSRPGQPERFDASSLDRKGFAAASSSPMLGKLLSEKQMPEGGWRAVETGGGSLVISFEDGDVAGNFARRVASNGYSATAPVQSIGRYWNVEVKNG